MVILKKRTLFTSPSTSLNTILANTKASYMFNNIVSTASVTSNNSTNVPILEYRDLGHYPTN